MKCQLINTDNRQLQLTDPEPQWLKIADLDKSILKFYSAVEQVTSQVKRRASYSNDLVEVHDGFWAFPDFLRCIIDSEDNMVNRIISQYYRRNGSQDVDLDQKFIDNVVGQFAVAEKMWNHDYADTPVIEPIIVAHPGNNDARGLYSGFPHYIILEGNQRALAVARHWRPVPCYILERDTRREDAQYFVEHLLKSTTKTLTETLLNSYLTGDLSYDEMYARLREKPRVALDQKAKEIKEQAKILRAQQFFAEPENCDR